MPLLSCKSESLEKLLIHWLTLVVGVLTRGAEEHVAVRGCRVAR